MDEEFRTPCFMYIMQRKPKSWQERMLKIIDRGAPLPKNWRMRFLISPLTLVRNMLKRTPSGKAWPLTKRNDGRLLALAS